MNDGRIAEQGTHEDLLARDGFYAEPYNSQFADPLAEAVQRQARARSFRIPGRSSAA